MKTVSSICAAGSSTALSAVGLALARPDHDDPPRLSSPSTRRRLAPPPNEDMTAIAAYPSSSPFVNTTGDPQRFAGEGDNGRLVGSIRIPNKRRSDSEKATSFTASTTQASQPDGERRGGHSGTPSSNWYRRLSSSMSSSRDSSRTPTSRPASAVISQSNGSIALSYAGSTTPIFQDTTSPYSAPNKLVKRSSSVHNPSSPLQASGSKLPILRRPATSHQRSATLQEAFHISNPKTRQSLDGASGDTRSRQWRHYFTPRISSDEVAQARRRSATGIPNPIKRVYPDRRYIPTLVSAKDLTRPVDVELDDDVVTREENVVRSKVEASGRTVSSPIPPSVANVEESASARRSFSISDLLSIGPQPPWQQPTSAAGKSRPWSSRSLRNNRPRVLSEPRASMGNRLSSNSILESERPAKRRDLTDPELSRRSIYSSTNSTSFGKSDVAEIDLGLGGDLHSLRIASTEPLAAATLPSDTPPSPREHQPAIPTTAAATKSSRLSSTPSEIPSTVGSDSDTRSVGDNSTDYQSDTFFDSYPTRTTRSSSGRRGPHIETIFDESPPNFSSGRSTKLRDFLSDGIYPEDEYTGHYRHSTIEEEESVLSTPVRSLHSKSLTSTPSGRPGAQHTFSSSPPVMNIVAEVDDLDWDAPEDEQRPSHGIESQSPFDHYQEGVAYSLPVRFGAAFGLADPNSNSSTPQRNGDLMKDRANLFELAEQQPSPNTSTNSPPRPKTVHGKKDQDSRWSRPTGRRGPSAMHARSHSVPVAPELDGKRDNVVANKFGTWGVGSKAVTEDWDEDFEFDPPQLAVQSAVLMEERRIDSGHEMFVPRSIREQQENVVANITLLREWGLLIEELKELRIRAVGLDMLNGPYAQSWREVDAMIELADQESAEHTLEPRASPPSSPGFDATAFEEPSPSIDDTVQSCRVSHDVEASSHVAATQNNHLSTPQSKFVGNRPRKDSELVAQSVIAALQARNRLNGATAGQADGPAKKVPFDTATLRHIVPYVKDLKRLVKDAMRETEGLYSSPRRRSSPEHKARRELAEDGGPSVHDLFHDPQQDEDHDMMTRRPSRRERAAAAEARLEQNFDTSRRTASERFPS